MARSPSPPAPPRDLLLATDASGGSRSAEETAIDLAVRYGARLHILRAVVTTAGQSASLPRWVAESQEAARNHAEHLRAQAGERGLEVDSHVCSASDPYAEIAAAARKLGCALIVVGHHEGSDLARVVTGHTVNRLIEKAHCGVLVVPEGAALPVARVLVATDGSPFAEVAVHTAVDAARRFSLPLAAVSVHPPGADDARRARAREAIEAARQTAGEAIPFDGRCLEGKPAREIVDFARESGADLIVLGSLGRSGLGRLLMGSVAQKVVSRAPCAVWVTTSG